MLLQNWDPVRRGTKRVNTRIDRIQDCSTWNNSLYQLDLIVPRGTISARDFHKFARICTETVLVISRPAAVLW